MSNRVPEVHELHPSAAARRRCRPARHARPHGLREHEHEGLRLHIGHRRRPAHLRRQGHLRHRQGGRLLRPAGLPGRRHRRGPAQRVRLARRPAQGRQLRPVAGHEVDDLARRQGLHLHAAQGRQVHRRRDVRRRVGQAEPRPDRRPQDQVEVRDRAARPVRGQQGDRRRHGRGRLQAALRLVPALGEHDLPRLPLAGLDQGPRVEPLRGRQPGRHRPVHARVLHARPGPDAPAQPGLRLGAVQRRPPGRARTSTGSTSSSSPTRPSASAASRAARPTWRTSSRRTRSSSSPTRRASRSRARRRRASATPTS